MRRHASASEPGFRRAAPTALGFTLLEVLVVVVIIGVLTAMLLPNLAGAGRWRDLKREADTLTARIRVAQDDAMLYGREYGLVFSEAGYRFVVWDEATMAFREPESDERWLVRRFDDDIRIAATADSDEPILVLPESEETSAGETPKDATGASAGDAVPAPGIYVLSSGEVTPFRASFSAEGEEEPLVLQIDALGNRVFDDAGDPRRERR